MFYEDARILVTGGTGFVGRHTVEELLKQGATKIRVTVHSREFPFEGDSRIEAFTADLEKLDDALAACEGVQYVFHCAGSVGAAGVSPVYSMASIAKNLVITARCLEAAWHKGVERFLLYSSSTIYPAYQHAVKEEEAWTGDVFPGYFGYGWMRRYLERLGEYVERQSEMAVPIVRPTAPYGRYDNFGPTTAHVIPALIRRVMDGEEPFLVWGTGEDVRDFQHASDLARGSLAMLEKLPECGHVNIGYGKGATVKEIVRIILKAAGRGDVEVVFDATKPSAIPFRMVDTTLARELLGFESRVSLEEGLTDTVRWYAEAIGHPLAE